MNTVGYGGLASLSGEALPVFGESCGRAASQGMPAGRLRSLHTAQRLRRECPCADLGSAYGCPKFPAAQAFGDRLRFCEGFGVSCVCLT
jgi:hypothetical protein